jgi:hypothetical protein
MLDQRPILARLDHERRTLARQGEVLDSLPHITRLRTADHSRHHISFSALTEETTDAAIAREIAHHRALNAPFEWKLYAHDTPPDLLDRLRQHGLDIGPLEAFLILDLTNPPAWIFEISQHTVTRVDRIDQVPLFRQVAEQVFQKDYTFTADELTAALRANSSQHRGYIALDQANRAVSIGRLYIHPDSAFAGLYGGGTLASHRGRGFYRALVAARARDAIQARAQYLQVDALPTSRHILQQLGFEHLTDTWPCDWRPT